MGKRTRAGRKTVFTRQQNHALRLVMRELEPHYGSQTALGRAIGIEQQNVGRLLRDRRAGFAYATATAVVQLAGYASVDAFFTEKGHSVPAVEPLARAS